MDPNSIPDPIAAPGDALSLAEKLYHSGAFMCLGIVVCFIVLRLASTRVPWLEQDHRAVYVAALLGGLGVLVVPASQGTTPNASMLLTATLTVISLAMNPRKLVTTATMVALLLFLPAAAGGGCGAQQHAAEGQLLTCAETAAIKDLIPTVENILSSGVSNWEKQLDALGLAFGRDALGCALVAAEQAFGPKTGGAVGTQPQASARAGVYLQRHGMVAP